MKAVFLLSSVCVLLAGYAPANEFRVFTNTKGSSIKAKILSADDESVRIQRDDGRRFTLPLPSLSAEDREYVKMAAIAGEERPVSATPFRAGANDHVSVAEMNAAAGVALFGEQALWDSPCGGVARRMRLEEESNTSNQSSYRIYPQPEKKMFGAHPYSVAMYAVDGRVTSLSLVFANRGDLFSAKGGGELHFNQNTPPADAAKIVRKAMDDDLQEISASLTRVLGAPKKERFGERGVGLMNMLRWDWRGHAILLADAESDDRQPGYVGLQIVPAAFADAGGKMAKTPDSVIREHAKSNIESREGGDVVIANIPMVDQGPKGYCVPATVERAMRFMGVPADMYVLANAGGTGYGGGTSMDILLQSVGKLIRSKCRSFEQWQGELKMKEIARNIDKGIPVMWTLYSTSEFNRTANARTAERAKVSDWPAWKKKIETESVANNLTVDEEKGHVVLIIGYNKETGEIAFSDSWGERYKERWISIAEAERISQKRFYKIGF